MVKLWINESPSAVRKAIASYLVSNPPSEWSTVELMKQICKDFLILDASLDSVEFVKQYRGALHGWVSYDKDEERAARAREISKALPLVEDIDLKFYSYFANHELQSLSDAEE